jgi:hypothetical protein
VKKRFIAAPPPPERHRLPPSHNAFKISGSNLTETLRTALRDYNHRAASRRLLAMRGQISFALDWRTLRGKDED